MTGLIPVAGEELMPGSVVAYGRDGKLYRLDPSRHYRVLRMEESIAEPLNIPVIIAYLDEDAADSPKAE